MCNSMELFLGWKIWDWTGEKPPYGKKLTLYIKLILSFSSSPAPDFSSRVGPHEYQMGGVWGRVLVSRDQIMLKSIEHTTLSKRCHGLCCTANKDWAKNTKRPVCMDVAGTIKNKIKLPPGG